MGAFAASPFIVYVKGDLNFDGELDLRDAKKFHRLMSKRRAPKGWHDIMDMDRDGDVDRSDLRQFRTAVNLDGPKHRAKTEK